MTKTFAPSSSAIMGRTHKWEMDKDGNIEHSDSCWCLCGPLPEEKVNKEEEPKNNDGRKTCFWCGKATVRKELFTSYYEICEGCGK